MSGAAEIVAAQAAPSDPFRWLVKTGDRVLDSLGYRRNQPQLSTVLGSLGHVQTALAFDRWPILEPLEHWLSALREEANLNAIGRLAAHYDAVRLLRTVCRFANEERRRPTIIDEPIAAPIFITGMPRSGTTTLHRLIAADPAHRAPRCWEVMAPYPPIDRLDDRHSEVERQLRAFCRLSPGLSSMHPLAANTPQECTELFSPTFRSLRFDSTHHVPSYRRWLDEAGHAPAYDFHRTFLQHLQAQARPRTWVLKSPDHVFSLGALLDAYPDARLIFLHRDPLKVLPSNSRLVGLLRAPFSRTIDQAAIARKCTEDLLDASNIMMTIPQSRQVLHLRFDALRTDAMAVVEQVYAHFGMPLSEAARSDIAASIRQSPRGGYGANRYPFRDYDLDPDALRAIFKPYTDHFAIPLEHGASSSATLDGARGRKQGVRA